jgi:Tfp pilus assembly protein PilN
MSSGNNIELNDESLAVLLNTIYAQIQEDRSITRDQFEALAAQVPTEVSPSSTFVAAELAKGIAGYLAEFTDSTEKMLKLAKILSDRLIKTEVDTSDILQDNEKLDAQDFVNNLMEAKKNRENAELKSASIENSSIAGQLEASLLREISRK